MSEPFQRPVNLVKPIVRVRSVRQSGQIEVIQRTENNVSEKVKSKHCYGNAGGTTKSHAVRLRMSDFLMGEA